MTGVNTIFMFTLAYSKGQYFDFNPNPFAATVVASLVIPLITGMTLFAAARTATTPFIFTSVIAVFMLIHSTVTIISNNYFVMLYPLYLLNSIPALAPDIVLQYRKGTRNILPLSNVTKCRSIIASSTMVSIFLLHFSFHGRSTYTKLILE